MKVDASTQTDEWTPPPPPEKTAAKAPVRQQPNTESASPALGGLGTIGARPALSKQSPSESASPLDLLKEPKVATPRFNGTGRFQAMRLPSKVETRDVGMMTKSHDIHNHSVGPGYGPLQIYDVTKKLVENLTEQMKIFDEAGIDMFLWSPIPTIIKDGRAVLASTCGNDHGHDHSIDGDAGHSHDHEATPLAVGKSYYMDNKYRDGVPMTVEIYDKTAKAEQYYNTAVDWQVGKAYNEAPPEIKKRCYPAVTGNNQGDSNAVLQTLRLKKEYPNTFFFFGEETVYKEFVSEQNLDYKPDLGPKSAINDHYRAAARFGMPKLLHCDSSNARNCIRDNAPGKGEYRQEIEDFVARHPNTDITLAHFGGLSKYGAPQEDHEEWLDHMLTKYPNFTLDGSWDVAAEYYSPNPQKPTIHDPTNGANYSLEADLLARQQRIARLAAVMNKHPTRFIKGSDALISRKPESLTRLHGLLSNLGQGPGTLGRTSLYDRLHPDTLAAFEHGNFEARVEKAVRKGREYESGQMQKDLDYLQAQAIAGGRAVNNWPDEE
jgi:hypothetical protein